MRTEADENYLKEIYALEQEQSPVSTSRLARRFSYSPATITGMLKKLHTLGLVHYEPYQGVSLTDSGQVIALKVLRRHRLIETFLVQILQIPWELVHSEADRLEHSLSDYLEERMDELLGHPSMDPHGSPIPGRDGKMDAVIHLRLADLPVGASAEIVEVNDRDPQLLTRLDQLQLQPNSTFKVVSVEPLDGLVTIQVGTAIQTFGPASASQIYVRVLTDVEHAE
jgi:DtxR family Mn-dependent transcriptional regulator